MSSLNTESNISKQSGQPKEIESNKLGDHDAFKPIIKIPLNLARNEMENKSRAFHLTEYEGKTMTEVLSPTNQTEGP